MRDRGPNKNHFITLGCKGILAILCCLNSVSCVTRIEEANVGKDWYAFFGSGDSLRSSADQLSATDGISIQEACFLSSLYFVLYNGECGGSYIKGHSKKEWIFDAFVGTNATTVPLIKVNKKTGHVRQRGHPTSIPPWPDLMDFLNRSLQR